MISRKRSVSAFAPNRTVRDSRKKRQVSILKSGEVSLLCPLFRVYKLLKLVVIPRHYEPRELSSARRSARYRPPRASPHSDPLVAPASRPIPPPLQVRFSYSQTLRTREREHLLEPPPLRLSSCAFRPVGRPTRWETYPLGYLAVSRAALWPSLLAYGRASRCVPPRVLRAA